MANFKFPGGRVGTASESGGGPPELPGRRAGPNFSPRRLIPLVVIVAIVGYAIYFWEIRRVVVDPGHVLVLLKKNGSIALPDGQFVIPRPPSDPAALAQWEKQYADCNGILEQVYPEGTYFQFSPFDYERELFSVQEIGAEVPSGKVGLVVRKFGLPMKAGQTLASPGQAGPLLEALGPGTYKDYANPYAYEIKLVDAVNIGPGNRGVVAVMAHPSPLELEKYLAGDPRKDTYLATDGALGVQKETELEGIRYINLFAQRVMPVSIRSQRFEMSGADAIRFPSTDSFEIRLEGFVEWQIEPERLSEIYVQYGEGGELLPLLEKRIILPYARSFCRLMGSTYSARDFISGDTKLKFQHDFEEELRKACHVEGIRILQANVRNIEPPAEIKGPITEREIAKQQALSLQQQILTERSKIELTTQEETAKQNQALGDARRQVVTTVQRAEQEKNTALTQAEARVSVAKLLADAAEQQASAKRATGEAEASVIFLQRQAEAEPLKQQVQAFGDGTSYAQFFFYQKVAPSLKTILADTNGTFGDLFRQFIPATQPAPQQSTPERTRLTGTGTDR